MIICVMDVLVVNAALSRNRHGKGRKWVIVRLPLLTITNVYHMREMLLFVCSKMAN